MFGDHESYEGEGTADDDDDFSPRADARRARMAAS
jgi:hypothetical protein